MNKFVYPFILTNMDSLFELQNRHLDNSAVFKDVDPDLVRLQTKKLIFNSPLIDKFPTKTAGFYTFCGAYRTGKTTILKKWIEKLISLDIHPEQIIFFSGGFFKDYHELYYHLKKQTKLMPSKNLRFLIVDEIVLVRDWQKAISLLLEEKLLEEVVFMMSSSDSSLKEKAIENFSKECVAHFYSYPLSFREAILLKKNTSPTLSTLYSEFNSYLLHGGYLDAINEIEQTGIISDKLLINYAEWINKLIQKKGKQERFLKEILSAIFKHYNRPVTWNILLRELSIEHAKTIGDYFSLLESLDIVFVQSALLEKTLEPAPKKARKTMFADPFLFHALFAWQTKAQNYFESNCIKNPDICLQLVESTVIMHFKRFFPTYYIKDEGEVDLVCLHGNRFWPIKITWTSQLRAKDLKQILKYPNGRILTKTDRSGLIDHIKTEPLPLALWQLEDNMTY